MTMGRIYEALRRADRDAGRDSRAPTSAPHASPWLFAGHERVEVADSAAVPAIEAGVPASTRHPASADDGRPLRRGRFDPSATERLVVSEIAGPLLVEQFRTLAATLHQAQREQPLKSVIVTSAAPGDGKSHVAINLALTLSESYRRRVLLIDADLRRPSLHALFRIANDCGLSEALRATTEERVSAVQLSGTLALLPGGRPEASPLGALASDRMKHIVEDAACSFDWVIVDAPPVGVLADARLVSETVDTAIFVVRAGVTRFPDVQAAIETLGHERILGIVLNAVDPGEIRSTQYYQHYYGSEHAGPQ